MGGISTRKKELEAPRNYLTLAVVAAFILVLPLWARLIPGEILHMDIVNLMVLSGIYACAVIGLNLLVGYAGQVSLGHAAFFGIGAYTVAILCTRTTWFPTWLAILLGSILAGTVGWLVGKPVLRLSGHYLAMATLGFGEIVFILFREVTALTQGTVGITGIPALSIFGFEFDTDLKLYYIVWIIVIVMMLVTINIIRSRVGRALRALHSSEVAADAMGIHTSRYKTNVFVMSAVFAGIGGGLFALFQRYVNPDSFHFAISVLFLTMVVVGGMGNVWGGIVGVITLTFLPSVITALPEWIPVFPDSLQNFNNYTLVLYGLLLILFMMFMPRGVTYGLSRAMSAGERGFRRIHDRISARKYEGD